MPCACGKPVAGPAFSKCAACLSAGWSKQKPQTYSACLAKVAGVYSTPPRQRRARGGTPESLVLHQVEDALHKLPGVHMFRNTVSLVRTASGGMMSTGLCKGSGDLIGWVEIGGRAVFASLEVKSAEGRVAPHQQAWADKVHTAGGIAAIVRSAVEAVDVVLRAQRVDTHAAGA